jgi:DNA-directed RNA polymerase specialized sigma24 family protein
MDRSPVLDPAWIRDAQRGRDEAIAALYRHFAPEVERYTERRMGPRARRWRDPSEVAHEVLWEVLKQLPPDQELASDDVVRRLLRTARSRILDGLRRHERELDESTPSAHAGAAGQGSGSVGSVTRADSGVWLRALIDRLPPDYGEVLRLCALEERSFVEAGNALGVAPDTLRKRYDRAWHVLRRKVAERERQ